jgi:hypothetical protein
MDGMGDDGMPPEPDWPGQHHGHDHDDLATWLRQQGHPQFTYPAILQAANGTATMNDCPYRLRMEGVPGADLNGTCSYGCQGPDGPRCLELGPMTDTEIAAAANIIQADGAH